MSEHMIIFIKDRLSSLNENTATSDNILHMMQDLEETIMSVSHENPANSIIKIHGFTYVIVNNDREEIFSAQVRPSQRSFLALGPRAFAKMFAMVMVKAIASLKRKIALVPLEEAPVMQSLISNCKTSSIALYRICTLSPQKGGIHLQDRITNAIPRVHILVENGLNIS
jgi:hypothetical protein